jgi:hypothetical protein
VSGYDLLDLPMTPIGGTLIVIAVGVVAICYLLIVEWR